MGALNGLTPSGMPTVSTVSGWEKAGVAWGLYLSTRAIDDYRKLKSDINYFRGNNGNKK